MEEKDNILMGRIASYKRLTLLCRSSQQHMHRKNSEENTAKGENYIYIIYNYYSEWKKKSHSDH